MCFVDLIFSFVLENENPRLNNIMLDGVTHGLTRGWYTGHPFFRSVDESGKKEKDRRVGIGNNNK
jgi:hypothetical protein